MNRIPLALASGMVVWLTSPVIAPAQQQVYKWTDASGRVHYGERNQKMRNGCRPSTSRHHRQWTQPAPMIPPPRSRASTPCPSKWPANARPRKSPPGAGAPQPGAEKSATKEQLAQPATGATTAKRRQQHRHRLSAAPTLLSLSILSLSIALPALSSFSTQAAATWPCQSGPDCRQPPLPNRRRACTDRWPNPTRPSIQPRWHLAIVERGVQGTLTEQCRAIVRRTGQVTPRRAETTSVGYAVSRPRRRSTAPASECRPAGSWEAA